MSIGISGGFRGLSGQVHHGREAFGELLRQFGVAPLLHHVGEEVDVLTDQFELILGPVVELDVEPGALEQLGPHLRGEPARLVGLAELVVMLHQRDDHVVVAGEADGHRLQRIVLHHFAALVHHLEGPVVLAGLHEGVGAGDEQAADGHHAEVRVHVLVVPEIVSARERVPFVDLRHPVIERIGVHETGFRGRGLVLDRHELEGVAAELEIFLDADVEVAAHVEQVQRAVPLVAGEQVEQEQLGLAEIVLVLADREDNRVGDLRRVLRVHDAVLDHVLPVHRDHDLAGRDVVHLAAAGHRGLDLGVLVFYY